MKEATVEDVYDALEYMEVHKYLMKEAEQLEKQEQLRNGNKD